MGLPFQVVAAGAPVKHRTFASVRSIPILCAFKIFPQPIIELHIATVHRREAIYHGSMMTSAATAVIRGLGADGYPTAVAPMLRVRGAGAAGARCTRRPAAGNARLAAFSSHLNTVTAGVLCCRNRP